MPYKDPERQRQAQREYARRKRAKSNEYQTHRRKVLRAYIDHCKMNPCDDCGHRFPTYCMDFDHRRGIKKYELSKMANGMYSIDTINAEIAKCDLICANCHRKRTFNREHVLKRDNELIYEFDRWWVRRTYVRANAPEGKEYYVNTEAPTQSFAC